MNVEKNCKASHLRPVPANLKEYIRVANTLPAPHELPGADSKGRLPLQEYWQDDYKDLANKYPSFRALLGKAALQEEIPVQAVQRCRELKMIRSALYTIARHHRGQPSNGEVPLGRLGDLISVQSDPHGILRITNDPLLQALEGVEADRIRECEHCSKIYWAGRKDKFACDQCTHAARQKRYRSKPSR